MYYALHEQVFVILLLRSNEWMLWFIEKNANMYTVCINWTSWNIAYHVSFYLYCYQYILTFLISSFQIFRNICLFIEEQSLFILPDNTSKNVVTMWPMPTMSNTITLTIISVILLKENIYFYLVIAWIFNLFTFT